MEREKTTVEDINRSVYDIADPENAAYKVARGLSPDIVAEISRGKGEPAWMLDFRLRALEVYHKLPLPGWGPSLHELDLEQIVTYVRPNTAMTDNWAEVPDEIKRTFDRLGIPEAEKKALAGAGFPAFTCCACMGRGKKVMNKNLFKLVAESGELPVSEAGEALTEAERLIPKRMFSIYVPDNRISDVIETVINVNSKGNAGDGKIFVLPTIESYIVRTGEIVTGEEA
jgi:Fe-S cluster assembly scaffold protein SufB